MSERGVERAATSPRRVLPGEVANADRLERHAGRWPRSLRDGLSHHIAAFQRRDSLRISSASLRAPGGTVALLCGTVPGSGDVNRMWVGTSPWPIGGATGISRSRLMHEDLNAQAGQ